MNEFIYIAISTGVISLFAFVGVITLALKDEILHKILLFLVSLSAGALMGGAFLHLIPETAEKNAGINSYLVILIGFIFFFVLEKVLHWRHCHEGKCDVHTFHYMNLIGDSIHNFIDGLIIAASFMTSIPVGITTFFAIAAHEIPQEIGDFGVLIYGGFEKKKALIVNFIVALTVILGGIIGYLISTIVDEATIFLIPFAAGGFIYIAATDLVPEIKKELEFKRYMGTLIVFIIGILIMYSVKFLFEG